MTLCFLSVTLAVLCDPAAVGLVTAVFVAVLVVVLVLVVVIVVVGVVYLTNKFHSAMCAPMYLGAPAAAC